MSKWLRFHLTSGLNAADGRVVEPHVLDATYRAEVLATEMYYPEMERPETPFTHTYDKYGMGWFVGYYRGKYCIVYPCKLQRRKVIHIRSVYFQAGI